AAEELVLALGRRALQPFSHGDDVAAAAERLAGAGDDDDAHRVIGPAFGERRRPGIDHLEGEGVHALGPVERDGGDAVGDLETQILGHGVPRLASGCCTMRASATEMPSPASCRRTGLRSIVAMRPAKSAWRAARRTSSAAKAARSRAGAPRKGPRRRAPRSRSSSAAAEGASIGSGTVAT